MKRFLKVFSLLIVSLFALISGVDSALDHFSAAQPKNTLVVYNERGSAIVAYEGDLSDCKVPVPKPAMPTGVAHFFLHRT